MWHGSEQRPTMYVAGMDIKTAIDVARPKHIPKLMEKKTVHGWVTAALPREMEGLEGQAIFENVESKFQCARCIRQGIVEAPRLGLKMAMQILWKVEPEWKGNKMGPHIETRYGGCHQICSFMWADSHWILSQSKAHLEHMMIDLIEEAERWDLGKSVVDKRLC